MTYDEILSRFTVKKQYRDKAQCLCPAHDDREASLTVSKGDKGTVIHCHAGCDISNILEAVGLQKKDLFFNNDAQPVERWRRYVENRENRTIQAVYHYHSPSGDYAFTRLRLSGKKFIYGKMDGERFNYGLGGKSRKTIPAVYCKSLKALQKAIAEGKTIFYCEGEKDVETLYSRGYVAVTCGACGDWDVKCVPMFSGADLIILSDNDKPGIASATEIERDVKRAVKNVRVVIPTPEIEKGDISDYFAAGHSNEDFEQMLSESVTHNMTKESPADLDRFHLINKESGKVTGVFDYAIFEYIRTERDLFVMGGTPFIYSHGVYEADENGSRLKTMIRELIYPEFVKSTTIKRVYDLFVSAAELQMTFDRLNDYPASWINFRNGFYDPVTKQMLPHSPKYKAINQIPHEYKPGATLTGEAIEGWLQFIVTAPDDREMLLQFAGLSLTKDTRQQKFLVLNGEGGSGKSTVIRMIESMVGGVNVSNISLTDLQQRFASYGLLGKLLNSCADLEISALEDTSTLKKCLGEDTLRGEQKGKDAISFKSYAKLVFSTNELPIVKSEKTNGFFRRLLVLPMDKLPPRKRSDFFDELSGQLDYFIHLCVQALERMYQDGHLTESRSSKEAVAQLRCDSDTVQAFLTDETARKQGSRIERTSLYRSYQDYCFESDRQTLTRNNFYKSMRMKGYSEITSCGIRYFESISFDKNCSENCTEPAPDYDYELLVDEPVPFMDIL